ncbi:hypothetical protein SAMN05444166_4061 [Singulisphaera sp. GP187]|uniref:protealysin inhibitor emfourin n=1 Tax=Singulisphaera sp. GP187 TaxID=1882752 RepID=UPI00092A9266|nr:protealysin inhibitor emfourin [Singulisphaera sp. GP187]SIO35756.1 hypothetical protein SAMN05444166_4061 [Singulisphaera sp. GP187]
MRVTYERVGGQLPFMKKTNSIDTETMPDSESREFLELAARSGILGMEDRRVAPSAARDQFTYILTVEDGGKSRRVEVSDTDMPASIRPLIDYFRARKGSGGPRNP